MGVAHKARQEHKQTDTSLLEVLHRKHRHSRRGAGSSTTTTYSPI